MSGASRLESFVRELTRSAERDGAIEEAMTQRTQELLADLISVDDWLPDWCAQPDPDIYRQYLLHCDPLQRFSVVSFVWGPGQQTPIHDHLTWGVLGLLRGGERDLEFEITDSAAVAGEETHLHPGDIGIVSPTVGDVHQVTNGFDDQVSVSIHVYGANIGRVERHVFDAATGAQKQFISSYFNDTVPNIWNVTTN